MTSPTLPDLSALGLSAAAIDARRDRIGASDVPAIMSGDPARILRLWREKRGEVEPEDLSGNLAVQLGRWTEAFNLAWYQRETGRALTGLGLVVEADPGFPLAATLDARETETGRPVEAKHTGQYISPEMAWERYLPQLAAQTLACDATGAVLSVIRGNAEWYTLEYIRDAGYERQLIDACIAFWDCVVFGHPPAPLPPPPAPKPAGVRVYDMTGRNDWADAASLYLETRDAAQMHESAKARLRMLTPADATEASGHGITVKRDRRGALRISEAENDA